MFEGDATVVEREVHVSTTIADELMMMSSLVVSDYGWFLVRYG